MTVNRLRFRPLYDFIVVKRKENKGHTTTGGIYIPEDTTSVNDTYEEGTVFAVGSGKVNHDGQSIPPATKVGDVIVYRKNTDFLIKEDGDEYYVVSEGAVVGVKD